MHLLYFMKSKVCYRVASVCQQSFMSLRTRPFYTSLRTVTILLSCPKWSNLRFFLRISYISLRVLHIHHFIAPSLINIMTRSDYWTSHYTIFFAFLLLKYDATNPLKLIKSYCLVQQNGNIDFSAVTDLRAEDLAYSWVEEPSITPPTSSPHLWDSTCLPRGTILSFLSKCGK